MSLISLILKLKVERKCLEMEVEKRIVGIKSHIEDSCLRESQKHFWSLDDTSVINCSSYWTIDQKLWLRSTLMKHNLAFSSILDKGRNSYISLLWEQLEFHILFQEANHPFYEKEKDVNREHLCLGRLWFFRVHHLLSFLRMVHAYHL